MNISFELWITVYNIAYLFEKTPFYRPWLSWMGLDLRRAGPSRPQVSDIPHLKLTARGLISSRTRASARAMLRLGNASEPCLDLHHVSYSIPLKSSYPSPSFSSDFSNGGTLPLRRRVPSPRRLLDPRSHLHKYSCPTLMDFLSTRQIFVNAPFATNRSPTLHYYRLVTSFALGAFIPLSTRLGLVPSLCGLSVSGSSGR
jgi:hypothetical protein